MRPATRLTLVTAVGLASVALLVAGALGLASTVLRHTEHRSHVVRGPVSRVVVEGTSGDVALRPGPAGRVTVAESRHYWLREPKLSMSLAGGVLTVKVDCPSFAPDCSDDLRITAPPGVGRATVAVDSGDVRVSGARGALDLSADSGDVDVEDVTGAVRLRSDSGDVTARALRAGAVDVSVDSGDIDLAFLAAPRVLTARADSGDVELDLPTDRYRVDADADSGDVDVVGVLRDDTAARRVEAYADSGDVTVRGS